MSSFGEKDNKSNFEHTEGKLSLHKSEIDLVRWIGSALSFVFLLFFAFSYLIDVRNIAQGNCLNGQNGREGKGREIRNR